MLFQRPRLRWSPSCPAFVVVPKHDLAGSHLCYIWYITVQMNPFCLTDISTLAWSSREQSHGLYICMIACERENQHWNWEYIALFHLILSIFNLCTLNFSRNSPQIFQFRMVICSVPFTRSHTLYYSIWRSNHCDDDRSGWQVLCFFTKIV